MTSIPVEQGSEWQILGDDIPIRQGDILVLRRPRSLIVKETVIVITADCDIAQSKSLGGLAALKVITLAQYVREQWAAKHSRRLLLNDRKEFINSFNSQIKSGLEHSKELSETAITRWVSRKSAEEICDELQIVDTKARKKLNQCISKLTALNKIEATLETQQCFEDICTYYSVREQIPDEAAKALVIKKVRAELASLPDDTFLLSGLPGQNAEPHIVLLRSLTAISMEKVTTSAEQARELDIFLRLGRLAPAFKYAISQQFGLLYSRIGLPKEYEDQKKTLADTFTC
jgi:hypothetical protein